MRSEPLEKAIRHVGGVAKLARAIGVTSQAISQWKNAPLKRVEAIEKATENRITREELRPDIYRYSGK